MISRIKEDQNVAIKEYQRKHNSRTKGERAKEKYWNM